MVREKQVLLLYMYGKHWISNPLLGKFSKHFSKRKVSCIWLCPIQGPHSSCYTSSLHSLYMLQFNTLLHLLCYTLSICFYQEPNFVLKLINQKSYIILQIFISRSLDSKDASPGNEECKFRSGQSYQYSYTHQEF